MLEQEAIYARQSLDKEDSCSIESQIDLCKTLSKGTPLIFQDKGYSGKNTERPELQNLISKIESDQISKVLVYKLDRISRNITDFYKLYEIMVKHKCEFISVSENFDTSNLMGRAMMGILAVFAQMERENIQKRVKDNYYYRTAHTGSWAGGPAPYGFKNGRNKFNKPTLIPIKEEIEAVECMFAFYSGFDNLSLGEIARWLTEKGYKPRKAPVFTSNTISKILQNPIYVQANSILYAYFKTRKINFLNDEEAWDGSTSAHVIGKRVGNSNIRSYNSLKEQSIYLTNFEGFIPASQFVKVQDQLSANKRFTSATHESALEELSGILKCHDCKYAIKSYSKSTNGRPYLDCYGNRSLHICEERYNTVNFYELQKKVGVEIQKQIDDMENIMYNKALENQSYNEKIENLTSEIRKLLEISLHSDIAAEATAKIIEEKQTQVNELELKMQMNSKAYNYVPAALFSNPNIELFSHDTSTIIYENLHPFQKREVVKILIDKIYLTPDPDEFEIVWKI